MRLSERMGGISMVGNKYAKGWYIVGKEPLPGPIEHSEALKYE